MNFKQAHNSNFRTGRTQGIKYIVIHYTANDGDTAKNNVDYYARTADLLASAHYYVDKNEVWQSVKEGDTAYHCGTEYSYKHPYCRNSNSLGIELCSRYDGNLKADNDAKKVDFSKFYFEDAVVSNAVKLTKELMAKYNIPAENVIRHYDVTGKTCPAPMVIDVNWWNEFKAMLAENTKNNENEGVLSVEQYKDLKKEIDALKAEIKALKEAIGTIYKSADEIPEYYKSVKELVKKGIIKGTAENNLNLPEIMVRALVIADRVNKGETL